MQVRTGFNFEKVLIGFKALVGCWAIQEILGITVRNPLTVVFFVLIAYIYSIIEKQGIISKIISAVLTILFSLLTYKSIIASFDNGIFKLLSVGILVVGLFLDFYGVAGIINTVICKKKLKCVNFSIGKIKNDGTGKFFSGAKGVLSVSTICFVFWLPYFLYEFPGIMTADSLVQYEQVVGIAPFSNHHPVVHTFLFKIFYDLGFLISAEKQVGIATYTLAQMIFMAYCVGKLVCHLPNRLLQSCSLAFYCLVPFNGVFAVTIWKDIPFAGITMLLLCKLLDLRTNVSRPKSFLWVEFTVLCIFFALFRSNAWYAFVVWIPFVLYTFRHDLKRAGVSLFTAFLVVIMIKGPLMNSLDIKQPDFVESLSLPIQQVARCLVDDEKIDDESMALIEKAIDTTYIHELYAADFADNMKELVRAGHPEEIENNKAQYFRLWLHMVLSHPKCAIAAWYDLAGGYIYPDVSYAVGDIDGIMANDYGLYWNPLIAGKVIIKIKEIAIKLGSFIPVYGMLWSIGTYTWLLVISLFLSFRKKKYILGKLLLALLICTLLIASPVVDFRYGYALVMTIPLWLDLGFYNGKTD
ncbi:DUF6020 family protein [Butyrivibrio sp. YAB3001]|uniref:DUF6020 family protein n=1 Tax=Butyrivibrio sp. YAB3001 TaxID=1520812 RepID=UPI0008F63607|nr:DUF6020 family protein [Butyrivibrio sp. YAB3001]SFD01155.1 hypothetical protein SAMN02910398_03771 [Butyrivibrio sp. YAB3001]